MALKIAASTLQRIVSNVEVERKFNIPPKLASLLLNSNGKRWPPLRRLRRRSRTISLEEVDFVALRQSGQLIRDTYYDMEDGHLSKLGLWVRQRCINVLPSDGSSGQAQWNAKVRLAGHFNNSQFVEVDGKENVSDEVLRITGSQTRLEDLQVVSDLQTRRISWLIIRLMGTNTTPSAKMTVVLDAVTEAEAMGKGKDAFAHAIGEVELFQTVVTEGKDNDEHEAYRKEVSAQRMEELEAFMLQHRELFPTSPEPVGKLSAYYTWKANRSQP
ncbi:hypothetical protein GGS23DRAFT_595405 [Durotheca rogersii]|uniref:uncharacterized protein n=1 Tax=Durotheca rogersii TaxID=419775 RepID=UPI00221E807E|nr:uncharacterized protein GGS23DRAFT_595405 [Durotheca rogersii]KAI5864694.1 hypothetical protein GGS23DRAFT_595405 [Durotheca rogersii]